MDAEFQSVIIKEDKKGGWTYLLWPDSVAYLGTGKAVKSEGTMDGFPFIATLLPWGDGSHMLPIKADLQKKLSKAPGEVVAVRLHKAPKLEPALETKA